MRNEIGIFINDNLLSTNCIKKILNENILNIKFIVIEKRRKKKNYLFLFLFFKDFFKILNYLFLSFIKNENIENICKKKNVNCLVTENINDENVQNLLNKINFKNIFFINLNSKLKIYENYNNINFINIHLGDTQKYRGVFCLIHAIINNEEFFHITSHFINNKFDLGNIIYQKKLKIYRENLFGVYQFLFDKKIEVIEQTLKLLSSSNFKTNLNKGKTYKPPTFIELAKFYKSFLNYPKR